MEPDQLMRRGGLAQQVLDNEVWQESWQHLERRLTDELANPKLTDRELRDTQSRLVALRAVRTYFERVLRDGKVAEAELDLMVRKAGRLRNLIGG